MEFNKLLSSLKVPVIAYISLSIISFLAGVMQTGFAAAGNDLQAQIIGIIWSFLGPISYLLAAWATIRFGVDATKKFSLAKSDIAVGAVFLGILLTGLFVPAYFITKQQAVAPDALATWGAGLVVVAIVLSLAGSLWGSGEAAANEGTV